MGVQRGKVCAILLSTLRTSWWESDALYVWDPASDTDTAAVDPKRGAQLTKATSTAAVSLNSKQWDMTSACYRNASGMTGLLDTSLPFLMAAVIDRYNQTTGFVPLIQAGNGVDTMQLQTNGSNQARYQLVLNSTTVGSWITQATWTAGTSQVLWVYCNPAATTGSDTFVAGVNQTETTHSGVVAYTPRTIGQSMAFGGSYIDTSGRSACKHGMFQLVGNRSGGAALTLAQAKAIVQTMQTQGI